MEFEADFQKIYELNGNLEEIYSVLDEFTKEEQQIIFRYNRAIGEVVKNRALNK